MKKYFVFLFIFIVFSSCEKEETVESSLVGEWEFTNYYEYNYCSYCPEPKETTINKSDVSMSGTIYKKIIFLSNGEMRLSLNYPHYTAREEENRGTYILKNDSIFFNVKDVYLDGVKQTVSNNLYIDPDLTNTISYDYLQGRSFKFKFGLENDKLEIFQQDYDGQNEIEMTWIDLNGVEYTKIERVAKTEKVTYQRK